MFGLFSGEMMKFLAGPTQTCELTATVSASGSKYKESLSKQSMLKSGFFEESVKRLYKHGDFVLSALKAFAPRARPHCWRPSDRRAIVGLSLEHLAPITFFERCP
jgi:hypothetical protein